MAKKDKDLEKDSEKDNEIETDEKKDKKKKKKKKNAGLAFAIFLLVLIVIVIIIFVQLPNIVANIEAVTNKAKDSYLAQANVQEYKPEMSSNQKDLITKEEEKSLTIKIEDKKETSKPVVELKKPEAEKAKENPVESKKENEKTESSEKPVEKKTPAPTVSETTTQVAYTELSLCFVEINPEGYVSRKIVKRSVPKNDSPLSTAIKLLLEGPDITKTAERNCSTLIPEGTKLLSAKVQGGVAYLSFNDKFEFNPAGIDGTNAQLMQIVYTATSFSTVDSVQFLIEGEKKDYLEMEGLWIGSPLSRSTFR